MQGLIGYFPLWQEYVRAFLLSTIEDGISYTEARINFLYRCVPLLHTYTYPSDFPLQDSCSPKQVKRPCHTASGCSPSTAS